LSYRPQWLAGREVAFDATGSPLLLWLFAASALLFITLQVALLTSIRHFSTRVDRGSDGRPIRIVPAVEYFWTALPLFISILFFWAIWRFLSG